MIKHIVFFLLLMTNYFCHCQEYIIPKKVKFTAIKFSQDSTFMAVYRGKKAGIYDLKLKKYVVPMAKQAIVQSPNFDYFTVLENGGFQTYYCGDSDTLIPVDKKRINFRVSADIFSVNNLGGGFYLFNDHETKFLFRNKDGDDVWDFEHPYQGSGIYDFNTKTWVIPSNYTRITEVNGHFLALRKDSIHYSTENGKLKFSLQYDIYKKTKVGIRLFDENIKTERDIINPEIFGFDEIQHVQSNFYSTKTGSKKGLLYAEPFGNYHLNSEDPFWEEMLLPVYDFIHIDSTLTSVFTLRDSATTLMKYFHLKNSINEPPSLELKWTNPGIIYSSKRGDFLISRTALMLSDSADAAEIAFGSDASYHSGIEYINDSLVKIFYNSSGFLEVAMTEDEFDSLDVEGNTVYIRTGLFGKTGIFNYKNNEWLLSPNYWNVHFAGDQIIVEDKIMDSQNPEASAYNYASIYSTIDLKENTINAGFDSEELRQNPEFFKMLFSSNKYIQVSKIGAVENINAYPIFQCHKSNAKMDIFSPGRLNITPYTIIEDVDFGMADPESFALLCLKDDSIILNFNGIKYSSSREAPVQFFYQSRSGKGAYRIQTISGDDTLESSGMNQESSWSGKFSTTTKVQLIVKENKLILNFIKKYHHDLIEPAYYENWGEGIEEMEYSAIWEKTDSGYFRISPFYAEILEIPAGYIAKTGKKTGDPVINKRDEFVLDEKGELKFEHSKKERYILLDKDLKAVELMDFFDFNLIEDLSFGLKVCTDRGCMFVTYDGEALTQDEWDDFELTNGKITAISVPQEILDDEGNPMRADGRVQIFQLPKK
jgi:hypothetical protein